MHVFRLGSKSVNYANRMIMQNESHENYPPLSYQLMRNMSLSSISDVETIPSDHESFDEIVRHRQFSISSLPDSYRHVYSRPETELRCVCTRLIYFTHNLTMFHFRLDDVSSGYSSDLSPSSPSIVRKPTKSSTTTQKLSSSRKSEVISNFFILQREKGVIFQLSNVKFQGTR